MIQHRKIQNVLEISYWKLYVETFEAISTLFWNMWVSEDKSVVWRWTIKQGWRPQSFKSQRGDLDGRPVGLKSIAPNDF